MIISASRRTDIPAFYPEWLRNRVRTGRVEVRNPFNPHQVKQVSLCPEDVDAIVLWTRNPAPLLPYLKEIEDLGLTRHYWLMTLNAMPRRLEPAVPKPAQALKLLHELSRRVGPQRLVWRFDPVFLTDLTPPEEHLRRFEYLAARIGDAVQRVVISFADIYGKVPRNVARAGQDGPPIQFEDIHLSPQTLRELAAALAASARRYGLHVQSCAETLALNAEGVPPGKCIDAMELNRVFDLNLPARKDPGQRKLCGCTRSVDIGAYDTCLHGCVYCYATRHTPALRERWKRHDADQAWLGA